ncbi:acetylcholine receptor subunit epsilon isoform X2 [Phycodurus eques]|uniref:acetylcholine receptor subunit epsilon isoform X2 n=1 Tax=Phycodurus eques TaxID=693459 RepID=UPI002ACE71FD|nr:acetylcholine receptor subunit epsilon isoform X2 [Phycodurus eques]
MCSCTTIIEKMTSLHHLDHQVDWKDQQRVICAFFKDIADSRHVECNEETQLIGNLFKGYNKNIRPVVHPKDKVEVQIKLTLTNLISLVRARYYQLQQNPTAHSKEDNEKEETLTTNVWIEIKWVDYRLAWNKSKYYGIDIIRVPCKTVWLPDIVLENNIDGKFDVAYYANVLISNDGSIYWLPPAIYRSTCAIEINYFPFDYQNCTLAFRSQTYSANEVDLILAAGETGERIEWVDIDPEAFTENGEWAIVHRPARKMINLRYSPDDLEYQEISFNLVIQRKPLFYVINIILPCSLISSLVVLAYFLPAQAGGQKLTVSISVLLAQTVFLFLIAQKVPETSLSVPLIGKYIIFVMCVTTLIATNQIVVLNFSLRSPSTHTMSHQIKHLFLESVPRFLGMSPLLDDNEVTSEANGIRDRRRDSFGLMQRAEEYVLKQPRSEMMFDKQREKHGLRNPNVNLYKSLAQAAPEIKQCVDACNFIAETTRQQNNIGSEIENWVLIGKMIDKVCFWAAILLFIIGTVGIFLTGHFNRAPEWPFPGENNKYVPK